MKKLLLICSIIAAQAMAMQRAEAPTINLKLGDLIFPVPASIALQANTLRHIAEDLNDFQTIELPEAMSAQIVAIIAKIMRSCDVHKDLKNKALLDAIAKDVSLSDAPLLDLLAAFNYIDFPIGIALIARAIATNESWFSLFSRSISRRELLLNQFMQSKELKDLRPLVAKYYYLLNKTNLAGVDENSYGFSVQDYLDYQPEVIAVKRNGNNLFLNDMRLNSLEGLGNINDLANLQVLYLYNNQLASLPAGIFNGLVNLQVLHLYNNQLTALPAGIFNGLVNLQVLHLYNNQLTALPAGIFNGLANLQRLYLYNNQLTALPVGIFNGLTNLQRLYLDHNQLTALPIGVFNGLASLQGLYLNNNQLAVLPAAIFSGLANLQVLYLSNNQLTALPAGIFNGLSNLQNLYLNDNQFTSLPAGIFNGLVNLRYLYLSNNQFAVLPAGIFNGLANLQVLYLYNNQLTALPMGIFNGLVNLQGLYLNSNQLDEITKKELRDALPGVFIQF